MAKKTKKVNFFAIFRSFLGTHHYFVVAKLKFGFSTPKNMKNEWKKTFYIFSPPNYQVTELCVPSYEHGVHLFTWKS